MLGEKMKTQGQINKPKYKHGLESVDKALCVTEVEWKREAEYVASQLSDMKGLGFLFKTYSEKVESILTILELEHTSINKLRVLFILRTLKIDVKEALKMLHKVEQ